LETAGKYRARERERGLNIKTIMIKGEIIRTENVIWMYPVESWDEI
jgi:hypothetical protein